MAQPSYIGTAEPVREIAQRLQFDDRQVVYQPARAVVREVAVESHTGRVNVGLLAAVAAAVAFWALIGFAVWELT